MTTNESCSTVFTVSAELDPPQPNKTMFMWADKMIDIRNSIDDLENELKYMKNQLDNAEQALFDSMLNNQIDQFKRNGYSFSPTIKVRASIKAENKDEAIEWLKESDYADIVKDTVNAQTLTSLIKEWEENGVRDDDQEFYDMINIYNEQKISIRKGR